MKKYLVILAAVMMVIAMVSGAFAGSQPVTVGASATITTTCNVIAGTLSFGAIDGDATADTTVSAGGSFSIKCTKGTAVTVTDDKGENEAGTQMNMKSGSDLLPYSISYTTTALTGEGAGAGGTSIIDHLALTGTVSAAQLPGVKAGSYTDTITLTLAY
jgi:spore coat protein U-like protein